jgi:hypothetical protein
LILNTGLTPQAGGPLERQLVRAILDGQCSETTSVRSEPAQIAVALSPAEFCVFGPDAPTFRPAASSPDRRAQAIQQLRKANSPHGAMPRSVIRGQAARGSMAWILMVAGPGALPAVQQQSTAAKPLFDDAYGASVHLSRAQRPLATATLVVRDEEAAGSNPVTPTIPAGR